MKALRISIGLLIIAAVVCLPAIATAFNQGMGIGAGVSHILVHLLAVLALFGVVVAALSMVLGVPFKE